LKRCEYKVPGGKLLCAKVEVEDGKISWLQISGDFFLLPETDLEDLEGQLLGTDAAPESVKEIVVSFFSERKTTLVGASAEDFAHVINTAISS
jgi:lipoate-protein ligase A